MDIDEKDDSVLSWGVVADDYFFIVEIPGMEIRIYML